MLNLDPGNIAHLGMNLVFGLLELFQCTFQPFPKNNNQKDDFAQLDNITVYLSIIYYWKYYGDINNS